MARASGMFGVRLGRGGQREHSVDRPAAAATAVDSGLAPGQGAGLVEQHGIDVRMLSNASRSLTSTPPRAARSVAMDTTSGMARPSACGQAMTSTVIVRMTASSGLPTTDHTTAVTAADPSANQNSQAAARSASRWARDDEFCASLTNRWMPGQRGVRADGGDLDPESGISRDGARHDRVAHTAADRAGLAGDHRLVDLGAEPATIVPSAGMLPPGRTTATSPTAQLGRRDDRDHLATWSVLARARPRRAAVRPASPVRTWSAQATASRSSVRAA